MKKVICIIVMFMMVCLMGGCSSNNGNNGNDQISLAVVVGAHSNAPNISVENETIKNAIYNSCYTYGHVAFLTVDGNPQVSYQTSIPKPETGMAETKKKSIASDCTSQLFGVLSNLQPEMPEVDTLAAIRLAAMTLNSVSDNSDKQLIIMDSGLSTTGYLNFTTGLLSMEPEYVVESLKNSNAIPDLSDITITWMYIGQTASPQSELSETQKVRLQKIWQTVLTEAGATTVTFTTDVASGNTEHIYPDVTVVDVEARELDIETEATTTEISEPLETVVLTAAQVEFVGDTADFVDRNKALESIQSVANQLLRHPNNRVYVIGTTATGGEEYCMELSSARAQAVTNELINCGVPEEQLIPIGLGFNDHWHIRDLDGDGKQVEELASQNRKVLIVDVNSADAQKLQ